MKSRLAVAAGIALFAMSGCTSQRSPTSASSVTAASVPLASTYSGVYNGQYRITDCSGQSYCFLMRGSTRSFGIRITQLGNAVTGLFVGDVIVDLAGTITADGEMTLTGQAPSTTPQTPAVEMTRFTVRVTADGDMTGMLAYVARYPDTAEMRRSSRIQTVDAVVISTTRGPLPDATSFSGTWDGTYVIHSCTTTRIFCFRADPGEFAPVRLTLVQSGATVTGHYHFSASDLLPVFGHVESGVLHLKSDEHPINSNTGAFQLADWKTTRDTSGRLLGTFAYVRIADRSNPVPWIDRVVAEIVSVVQLP